MGRLSGFKYREVARRLRKFGYQYDRPGPGSHEIWRHQDTGHKVTLPHHPRDFAEGTLRAVLREAGIYVEDFLKARRWAPHLDRGQVNDLPSPSQARPKTPLQAPERGCLSPGSRPDRFLSAPDAIRRLGV